MKSAKLFEQDGLRSFLLVMDKGDEAFEKISDFARVNGITGAGLTAVGACSSATLGYFDPQVNDYRSSRFDEQMEILSVIGDIATKDDPPALHAHVVLADEIRQQSAAIFSKCKFFPRWRWCSPKRRHISANMSTPIPVSP